MAVLWTTVAIAACAFGVSRVARDMVTAVANRTAYTQAAWAAEACAARALVATDAALREPSAGSAPVAPTGGTFAWRSLDRRVLAHPLLTVRSATGTPDCALHLRSAGTTLNVNAADARTLAVFLAALRMPQSHADSVAAAIVRVRDSVGGGQPFRAGDELAQVPGMDSVSLASAAPEVTSAWRTMVGVDSVRIDVLHAPPPVLATVPGLAAVADVIPALVATTDVGTIRDLNDLLGRLAPAQRATVFAQGAALQMRGTLDPDAWIATARASAGTPAVTAVLELWLVHAGPRVAVVRRRTWIE